MNELLEQIPSFQVLGARVHLVQMPDALMLVERWIQSRDKCRYIVATGMHGVMEAQRHRDFMAIVNSADLFVPDGISLIWLARIRGHPLKKRVTASDLMLNFLELAEEKGYKSFFYGETEETLRLLTLKLEDRFPQLKIVGVQSPPFRQLTEAEEAQELKKINESGADVVWVGLGLPKQERWMFEHRNKLNVPVVVGVGATFKFLAGQVRQAPSWVGDHGLEWLWRFFHEPRRLWHRVLIDGPNFAFQIVLDMSGLKKYR